jgi:hypothetical protein
MSLRFSAALFMGSALAVSALAHATTPGKATTAPVPVKTTVSASNAMVKSSKTPGSLSTISSPISIDGLAKVEGILSYCATVDPADAAQYHQAMSNIVSGHSVTEIKNDQGSSRYVSAIGALNAELAALPVSTVVSSCKNFLAGK